MIFKQLRSRLLQDPENYLHCHKEGVISLRNPIIDSGISQWREIAVCSIENAITWVYVNTLCTLIVKYSVWILFSLPVFKQPQRNKSFELGAHIQGRYHDSIRGGELLCGKMMTAFSKTVDIWGSMTCSCFSIPWTLHTPRPNVC